MVHSILQHSVLQISLNLHRRFIISRSTLPLAFFVSRAFMAGAASQTGDADSSREPGPTSGLQGSVNVHRCALLLVPQ